MDRVGYSLLSGLLVSSLLYPFDTAKRSMQMNGGRGSLNSYKSSIECLFKLPKQIGLKGMYRGYPLYLTSSVLLAFAQFTVYDYLRSDKLKID